MVEEKHLGGRELLLDEHAERNLLAWSSSRLDTSVREEKTEEAAVFKTGASTFRSSRKGGKKTKKAVAWHPGTLREEKKTSELPALVIARDSPVSPRVYVHGCTSSLLRVDTVSRYRDAVYIHPEYMYRGSFFVVAVVVVMDSS